MKKISLGSNKLAIIILCIAVLIGVYHMVVIRPFDKFWKESKEIMGGQLQPEKSNPLWVYYRLDWGEPYSLANEVKLDIKRSFVWRWGSRGRMMVNYTQEYYDANGNLLRRINGGAEWILEKTDGEWQVVDINVPNL